MSSSYIEHTTKEKNTSEQINKKSEHQEETKNIHNRINKNKKTHQCGTKIRTMAGHGLKKV